MDYLPSFQEHGYKFNRNFMYMKETQVCFLTEEYISKR